MAKNDVVLLDGIVDQRLAEAFPSSQRDEVFEFLSLEQTLKDYDLSREEIESGWVDGKDDGGIDGWFTIINGHLLRDSGTFVWPRRNAALEVWLITAKHHATFQQAPLNSILASVAELFDLALTKDELKGAYSDDLIKARSLFDLAYRRLSVMTPMLTFRFVYVSRGDSSEVAANIQARAEQIVALARSLFSSCNATFDFIGAAELVALYRRIKKFALDLPFVEYLSRSGDSYLLLTRLQDYFHFVTDEKGHLRRYLFDSNVRDYLGENRVNEDIANSLAQSRGPEFWWLNNGVTILATAATVLGKVIQLQDVQIVNGLQTTESVFNYFNGGDSDSADRAVLVKVVVSSDLAVRDQIIRATNNQSVVELYSLHATDKIQRDIEEILERHGWFYERRQNYYRNIGKPPARFVTPLYIASGYAALGMRNPNLGIRMRSRFMRNKDAYETVFSERIPLEVWPVIVDLLKRVEEVLETVRPTGGGRGERFLATWRSLIALLAVSRIFGTYAYSLDQLIGFDTSAMTADVINEIWKFVERVRPAKDQAKFYDKFPKGTYYCLQAAEELGIKGVEMIGKRNLPVPGYDPKRFTLTEHFIAQVNGLLPPQPWKQGIHLEVASTLQCSKAMVSAAIQELVSRGKWNVQRDGVVYDKDGNVLCTDKHRVPARATGRE